MSSESFLLLAGILALGSGCAGDLEHPERFGALGGGCVVETDLFPNHCTGSTCHSGEQPAAGLDLVSMGVAQRLVGISSHNCSPQLLIDPSAPDQSLLLLKLNAGPSCGAQMPFGRPPLASSDVDCVRRWITLQVSTATADGGADVDAGP
jgi:hypothetical protein